MSAKNYSSKQLPKVLFVYKEKDGDTGYFICNNSVDEAATFEDKRFVGVYELKKVVKVSAVAKIDPV